MNSDRITPITFVSISAFSQGAIEGSTILNSNREGAGTSVEISANEGSAHICNITDNIVITQHTGVPGSAVNAEKHIIIKITNSACEGDGAFAKHSLRLT